MPDERPRISPLACAKCGGEDISTMPDRRHQIRLLIATRFDYLWFPTAALRTTTGLAPTRRVPCPACQSSERPGWLPERRGGLVVKWTPCMTCGGREAVDGVRAKRGKGTIAVDPMDAQQRAVGSTDTHATSIPVRRVRCDSCNGQGAHGNGTRCVRCDGQGWRDLHRFNLRLEPDRELDGTASALDAAIFRRDQLGSYHQLDLALLALHEFRPALPRLLDDLYLHQTLREEALDASRRVQARLALVFVDHRMPAEIKVPADVVANAKVTQRALKGRVLNGLSRERRDKLIRQWDREGRPRSWIRQQAGLSDRQLREIINGTRSAA